MTMYGLKSMQGKKCADKLQFFFFFNRVYTDAWLLILIKASNRERKIFLLPQSIVTPEKYAPGSIPLKTLSCLIETGAPDKVYEPGG